MNHTLRGLAILGVLYAPGCKEVGRADESRPAADLAMPDPSSDQADLAMPDPDLAMPDLVPLPDLAMPDLIPGPDLAMPDLLPPMLNVPAACKGDVVTAAQVYAVVTVRCKGGGACHIGTGMADGLNFGVNADAFRARVVNQDPYLAQFKLVLPGDINKSYLLYKLTRQARSVPGGVGGAMPLGGMLSDTDKCLFIDWVQSGAG